jgi:hypothetical protein
MRGTRQTVASVPSPCRDDVDARRRARDDDDDEGGVNVCTSAIVCASRVARRLARGGEGATRKRKGKRERW